MDNHYESFIKLFEELNNKYKCDLTLCLPTEKRRLIDSALADGELEKLPIDWLDD